MMEVLNFTFQSVWHFCGVVILLCIVTAPIHTFMAALGFKLATISRK